MIDDTRVALIKEKAAYCSLAPFDPSEQYPELRQVSLAGEDNPGFRGVRNALSALGLDGSRYGLSEWNPLGEIVFPGNVVVVKPNLVAHRNLGAEMYGITDTDCLVTHGSIIRAVAEYVCKALRNCGKLIIGDCPIQGTSWNAVVALVGLDSITEDLRRRYSGIEFVVQDYRLGRAVVGASGQVMRRTVDSGRSSQYQEIDLGTDSLLTPLMVKGYEFGVSQYSHRRMRAAHTMRVNKYLFPRDFIYADAIINLPKLKVHMKAGITVSLKNFVGINGHKDYLPHYRTGSSRRAGDEYPDGGRLWDLMWYLSHLDWEFDRGPQKALLQFLAKICGFCLTRCFDMPRDAGAVTGGGWHGNDTLWRTILDINRAFFYFDRSTQAIGTKITGPKYLILADGIWGGERQGPLAPSPVPSGFLLAARNPVALDTVAAVAMGFDPSKIRQIAEAYKIERLPLANFDAKQIQLTGNSGAMSVDDLITKRLFVPFLGALGFRGWQELAIRSDTLRYLDKQNQEFVRFFPQLAPQGR